ncbi:MAG: type II toxin-antitoxin system VapC family toxin [Gammaproteobacteria bacterium]|nr:type II toxin-antitoxin system VapC family toxin [Gammaproteobacteria bacterium]
MYLVDTNVVSAGAPGRAHRSPALVSWMDRHAESLFLSVVSVTEMARGIAKQRRAGSHARAARLHDWLELLLHLYDGQVLPFDVAAARVAGQLDDRAQALGAAPGFADIVIAATASSRGLTVLTRNLRHFEPLGVVAVDPFVKLP